MTGMFHLWNNFYQNFQVMEVNCSFMDEIDGDCKMTFLTIKS